MNLAQQLLTDLNLPVGDCYNLPTSVARFPDGGHYRIEIPSVEGPAAMAAALEAAAHYGVPLHRVSQGSGMMLLTDSELREMARLGAQHQVEVSLFVGPRGPWEGSGQPLTPDGKLLGWRHTGMDQLAYAFEDVVRGVEAGIRSILVADEGLLWLVNVARQRGVLPASLVVKGSAILGAANPIGIRLLQENGLDTINVASDITLPRLAAMRQVLAIPIDLYIEGPDGLGGFTRYYEMPEIVRIGAPVYLKFGLRNAPSIYPSGVHLEAAAIATGRERVHRAAIGLEILARASVDYAPSPAGAQGLGIPVV
ncbi:MAG: hypothetical protein IPK16_25640 [Anaerolineales bacterium]|nr:hypothetical protein [Anaerolineales bacterium]